jgi:hypothetical protein
MEDFIYIVKCHVCFSEDDEMETDMWAYNSFDLAVSAIKKDINELYGNTRKVDWTIEPPFSPELPLEDLGCAYLHADRKYYASEYRLIKLKINRAL